MKKKIIKKIGVSVVIVLIILVVVVIACLLFLPSFGKSPTKKQQAAYGNRTEAFYEGAFHTPEKFELLVETDNDKSTETKDLVPKGKIPVNKITKLPEADVEELTVTWFGHSTSLLQMHGMTLLIDPVLSEYSSPVNFTGAKRMAEIPMAAEDFPQIDVLLISHDHYDHLDYETIRKIDSKVKQYVVPLGVENHLERWGVDLKKVHTTAWWEDVEIEGLTISSTPGQHYSGRLPWNKNQALWSGYFLQDAYHKVYYTGDTGYGEFFKEIRSRYGEPELVLLEAGQYNARWPYTHMNPQEVLKAAEDMGTKWMIPVHWSGFVLSRHAWDDSVEQLTALAENSEVSLATPQIGDIVHFEEIENYTNKWWKEVE